jgi:hypothetical protein
VADIEITPEPSDEEREAVLQVLADWLGPAEPEAYTSAWRQSGLLQDGDAL